MGGPTRRRRRGRRPAPDHRHRRRRPRARPPGQGGLLAVAALATLAISYPLLAGLFSPRASVADVAIGVAAHVLCGIPGLALGLLFSRSSAPRQAYAWLWLLICLVITIPVSGLASSNVPLLRWVGLVSPPVLAVGRALVSAAGPGPGRGPGPGPGPGTAGFGLIAPTAGSVAFSAVAVAAFIALARMRA